MPKVQMEAELFTGQPEPPATSQALTVIEPDAVTMFERLAKDPAVDVDKLQRLIDMQERIMRRQAEAAYNADFSVMQPEIPVIIEKGKTDKGTFAELEDIVEVVRPILAKHGFALTHKTEWPEKATVRVIGILTHRDGHRETSEFIAGADQSGSKNAIQALGSSVSYGRRYTTKDLLCIVTRGEDNDGKTAEAGKEPTGYADWFAKLEKAAERGLTILTAGFNEGSPEFKNYVTRTDKARWLALKTQAGKVKA